MSSTRQPEVNEILKLLSSLTKDDSLSYLTRIPDPKFIMQEFRKLWNRYSSPSVALKLDFGTNNTSENVIIFDKDIKLKCNCKKKSNVIMYINMNDRIFYEQESENIYSIYYCSFCNKFGIINQDTHIDFKIKNAHTLSGIQPILDMVDDINMVPYYVNEDCDDCFGELKIVPVQTNSYHGSKISGIYNKLNRKKYMVEQKLCNCYNQDNITTIARFSSYDIEILRKYNILEIRLVKCNNCNSISFDIYSQDLSIGHNTLMFTDEEYFYHIILEGDLKGIVLRTGTDKDDLTICGQINKLTYSDEKGLNYSNMTNLSEDKLQLVMNTFKAKMDTSIIKSIIILLDKLKYNYIEVKIDQTIIDRFGTDFYILDSINILKYSLVSIIDGDLTFYGILPDNFQDIETFVLGKYNLKQIVYLNKKNYVVRQI
jgi:hypothetical protein